MINCWKYSVVIIEFGVVGDGKILNIKVFKEVIIKFVFKVVDGGV